MTEKEIIIKAIKAAEKTSSEGVGGPFGAAVVDSEGNVYTASNTVLGAHDPTAHAEINAIRRACSEKKTHDLTGCVMYTTCFPCPMCLSAIIWANIKTVYYGATPEDAASIGFRDDFIYDFIQDGLNPESVLSIRQIKNPEECKAMFKAYAEKNGQMY